MRKITFRRGSGRGDAEAGQLADRPVVTQVIPRSVASASPRAAASPFEVGDPGRAALEVPAGWPRHGGPADAELSAAAVAGMLMRAATVRGLQHRASGTPRQDAFAISHQADAEGARAIAAVCDGVGSLGRSDEAAALVSRCLVSLAADGELWPAAFKQANEALRALASQAAAGGSGDPYASGMATTAVALAVHREQDDWVGQVAWVGDSSLWQLSAAGEWLLLSCPADAEGNGGDEEYYHSTGVKPLPSADGGCALREFRTRGGALFLMTDGVANPLRWSEDVRRVLAQWWTLPPDPYTFAAQVGFARKSHLDDRTVIGLWCDDSAVGDQR